MKESKEWTEAMAFFRTRPEPDTEILARFDTWLAGQRALDARNYAAHGNTAGLLHHIKVVHNWTDLSMDGMYTDEWTGASYNSSSKEIGIGVDNELRNLCEGTVLHEKKVYDYTRWLLFFLHKRRWLLCACQVPIWSHDETVRTHADMIVYDTLNRCFVLIELKTGYANHYDRVYKLAGETDVFENTKRIMCHLQLGWMFFELVRDRKFPALLRACVVRVSIDAQAPEPEPLITDVLQYYAFMCADECRPADADVIAENIVPNNTLAELAEADTGGTEGGSDCDNDEEPFEEVDPNEYVPVDDD